MELFRTFQIVTEAEQLMSLLSDTVVFCKRLQPRDQVIAGRWFTIQDMLAFYQCTLAIPLKAYKYSNDSNKYTKNLTNWKN